MARQETNDIIQHLLPALENIGIDTRFCKVDIATESTGRKRGDVWISGKEESHRFFEREIFALIEAKHKNSTLGDIDWRDAMRQGKEKALQQGLNYYIVTNCKSLFRFYNADNDEEIFVDGKALTKLVPIDLLKKIQTQVNSDNSNVFHKTSKDTYPLIEPKFRSILKELANIYRTVGFKSGDERIDPTITFVILKYISENEAENRTLPEVIDLWDDLREYAEDTTADLRAKFKTMIDQIWGEDSQYNENVYKDFKNLSL